MGLISTGAAPALGLSGEFCGVTVEVRHQVQERYKQSRLVTFVARAHLSEARQSQRVPEPAPADDLTGSVVGDWFQRSGEGLFGGKRLESSLLALVVAARYASNNDKRESRLDV